jgi:hypothetical protein
MNSRTAASVLFSISRTSGRSPMDRDGFFERYWCPVLMSGSLVFLAAIVTAPVWR